MAIHPSGLISITLCRGRSLPAGSGDPDRLICLPPVIVPVRLLDNLSCFSLSVEQWI